MPNNVINATDVVSQWGNYFLSNGQNAADLFKKLYQPSETAKYFKTIPFNGTQYRTASDELQRIVQPFQKAYTPTGNLTVKPNVINLSKIKVDTTWAPDELSYSWLAFLEGEGINRADWPFIKWLLMEHMAPKIQEDLEMNEIYGGVETAPTPGTAGVVSTSMNGLQKVMNDWVTASRSTAITMGAVPTDPVLFCTYVETFVKSLPALYRSKVDYLFMSEDLQLRYRTGKYLKYNMNYNAQDIDNVFLFPNLKVVGLPSMTGKTRIWTTPVWNRVRPVWKTANVNTFRVESTKRLVDIFTDWYEAIGFNHPESVFLSDQV